MMQLSLAATRPTNEYGNRLAREEHDGDNHDRQHPNHHHCNGEPVKFSHRENLAI
jgi:hypothetical protein